MRLCANVPGQFAIQTALGGYQSINDLINPGGRLYRQRELAWSLLTQLPVRVQAIVDADHPVAGHRDDEREAQEEVGPARVVGQHRGVEHVGVRDQRVRRLPDRTALRDRGVAVVDRRPHAGRSEAVQGAELILCERLRRVEVERPPSRVLRERVDDGQVERERLPRRRPGGDDHVCAGACGVPGRTLVHVEPWHAGRLAHTPVEVVGQRCEARLPRRLLATERELLCPLRKRRVHRDQTLRRPGL